MKIKILFTAIVVCIGFTVSAQNKQLQRPQPITPKQLNNLVNPNANPKVEISKAGSKTRKTHEYKNLLSGVLDSTYTWIWDTTALIWNHPSKIIYSYDANSNKIQDIQFSLDTTTWVKTSQNFYTYDAGNNMLTQLSQSWNGTSWDNVTQNSFTYTATNI